MVDDEAQRQLVAAVGLLFVIVLAGCGSPFGPANGTGELTVSVENQAGEPAVEQPVTSRNEETGERVFHGTTQSDGTVTTTLDYGTYVVATDDKTKTVQFNGDDEINFQIVTAPPRTLLGHPNSSTTPQTSHTYP